MTFTYDGDGRMVKSVINGVTTLYVGAHYEITNPGAGQTVSKYYFAGGARVAMRKYTIPQSMSLEYTLGDQLGSTSVTTNASGAKVSELRYKPWGEVRYTWKDPGLNTTPAYKLTDYTYTGQRSYTADFGLMFYQARWLDPVLGRFAQADNIPLKVGSVETLDRFAYVSNNPILHNDPTGHCFDGVTTILCTMAIGGLIGAAGGFGLVMVLQMQHPERKFTAQDYAAAVLVGATAGVLIGSGVGFGEGTAMAATIGSTLVGAGTGAAGSAVGYSLAAGSSYDPAKMAVAGGIGATTGAISGGVGALTPTLGGVANAAPVLANGVIQAGMPILNNQVQTLAFDAMDGKQPTVASSVLAPTAGVVGGGAGFIANMILPGAGPLFANGVGSYYGNWWQGEVDKRNKPIFGY